MEKITRNMLKKQIEQINQNIDDQKAENFNFNEVFRKFKRALAIGSEYQYKEFSQQLSSEFDVQNVEDLYEQKNKERNNVLHVACLNHRSALIRYIIQERGFQKRINEKNPVGDAPIHYLVINLMSDISKNYNLLDYLVSQGADVLSLNQSGKNILEIAQDINNNPTALKHIEKVYNKKKHQQQKILTLYILNYTSYGKGLFPYNKLNKNLKQQMLEFI